MLLAKETRILTTKFAGDNTHNDRKDIIYFIIDPHLSLMPKINVSGREYIGKTSVVKYDLRYLLEMSLFRGGCFLSNAKRKSIKIRLVSNNSRKYSAIMWCL